MRSERCGQAGVPVPGVLAGVLLVAVLGGWSRAGFAQSEITVTTSTSSSTVFESPPDCDPVGSSRTAVSVTLEETLGPGTILIGDRDTGGTPFEVLPNTINLNENTHTTTFECVLAPTLPGIPALSHVGLTLLLVLLTGAALWTLRRAPPG